MSLVRFVVLSLIARVFLCFESMTRLREMGQVSSPILLRRVVPSRKSSWIRLCQDLIPSLEGSCRFKCRSRPFGSSGLFNCRRFLGFVALGRFSCSFAVFFVCRLWLSHFVTFVLGQSVMGWTWFRVVRGGVDCFILLFDCAVHRVPIGVLLGVHDVCLVTAREGRVWYLRPGFGSVGVQCVVLCLAHRFRCRSRMFRIQYRLR